MKKLFALIALWPLLLSAQPVRLQFGTTNSGTVLTNINKSLATNVVSGNAIAKESGFGTNATFLGTTVIGNGRAFDSGLTATLGVMTEVFRGENLLFWTDQNNRGIMFTLDGVNCLAKVFVSDSAGKLIFDAQSISLTSEGNNSIIQLGFAGANGGTVKIQKDGSASNGSNRPTKRFNFNTSVWNGSGAQDFMLSLRGIVPGTTNNAERFLEFTQSSDDNGTEETRMALLSTNSLTLSVPLVTTQAHYTTNVSATATAPDFTKGYTLLDQCGVYGSGPSRRGYDKDLGPNDSFLRN